MVLFPLKADTALKKNLKGAGFKLPQKNKIKPIIYARSTILLSQGFQMLLSWHLRENTL